MLGAISFLIVLKISRITFATLRGIRLESLLSVTKMNFLWYADLSYRCPRFLIYSTVFHSELLSKLFRKRWNLHKYLRSRHFSRSVLELWSASWVPTTFPKLFRIALLFIHLLLEEKNVHTNYSVLPAFLCFFGCII